MKIPNIGGLVSVGRSFVMANRPELLLGMSVTGTLMTAISAARGGYKSGREVERVENLRLMQDEPLLTTKEKVNLTWINYLPAATATIGSISATTGLHIVHVKEKKMLAAACLMAIDEVKKEADGYEKSLKKLGIAVSDKDEDLENAADEDGLARVIRTDGAIEEMYLIMDGQTGRTRWSTKERIDSAVNEVNAQILDEGEASLDYFYSYAGFPNLPNGSGEELGWGGKTRLALKWETEILDDGRPVRMFSFRPKPKLGYEANSKTA